MALVDLANDTLQLRLDADRGASLLGLRVRRAGEWLALLPEPETSDLWCGSFLMVPYSNRIEAGQFEFMGQGYQLENAENHAIHGDVRKRPWQLVEASGAHVRLRFVSSEQNGLNWPWAFSAEIAYQLVGGTFSTRLSLRNESATAMPAGFGFHPYFVREPTTPGEPVRVQFSVTGVYPDALGTRIPSGAAVGPTVEQDFSVEKRLNPGTFHDFCACGYDGKGSIFWPESGIRVSFAASEALGHVVFYNPPKPYFAMEPVSNANDGVNLLARGDATSGVQVLRPGESLSAEWAMTITLDG